MSGREVRHRNLAILGSRGIPAKYGGFETFAERLGEMLVARGYSVAVYCDHVADPALATYKGIDLVYLPARGFGKLTSLLFDIRCLWHARKRYDVVYMLGYPPSLFCLIPRLWGREVWINMAGREWARSKWKFFGRNYLHFMEFIATLVPHRMIADAQAIYADLKSRYRHLPPCSVIAYGGEVIEESPSKDVLKEWNLVPEEYLLIVSRIQSDNHVREMIDGFLLSKSQRKLVVVGDNAGDRGYADSVFSIKDPRVIFAGGIYDQDKLRALRYHAWAYCHGHSAGGTNPSLLEAMGCGNATIAHDNVFNREVAGEGALYFSSPEECAAAVARLEADPGLRESMRRVACERVRSRYRWDQVADAYGELLDNVSETDSSPSTVKQVGHCDESPTSDGSRRG